jgi:hypothetical protein
VGVHIIKSDQPPPEHINARVLATHAAGEPVISVDTKKKELVGNYKNSGTDYRRKGETVCVEAHGFEDKTFEQRGALWSLRRDRRRGLGERRDHGRHGGVRGPVDGHPRGSGSSAPRPDGYRRREPLSGRL